MWGCTMVLVVEEGQGHASMGRFHMQALCIRFGPNEFIDFIASLMQLM